MAFGKKNVAQEESLHGVLRKGSMSNKLVSLLLTVVLATALCPTAAFATPQDVGNKSGISQTERHSDALDATGGGTLSQSGQVQSAVQVTEEQKEIVSQEQNVQLSGQSCETAPEQQSDKVEEKQSITVTFSLLGDDVHGDSADKHIFAEGTLQTWIALSTYQVAADSTVLDVFEAALTDAGYTWKNPTGGFIESIAKDGVSLGEFDNGPNSGWMFTVNGVHGELGVSEQRLKEGDAVVFHYSDDYTKEGAQQGNPSESDVERAGSVVSKIDIIGEVTLESEAAIQDARAAYDALTDAQKALVTNYDVLVKAEEALVKLKADVPVMPTFSAKVNGKTLDASKIAYRENGYSYTGMVYDPANPEADGWGYVYPVLTCGLYTVEVPAGTAAVDFEFSNACLAYGYDDDKFTCTEGADEYEGGFAGKAAATRSVDKDADGRMDFVQVQSPYDSNWNSTTFYAITFVMSAEEPPAVFENQIWAGAGNMNDANNQVTDVALPTDPSYTAAKWMYQLGTVASWGIYYAGQTVIVDGYLYATGGGKLHKIDLATGNGTVINEAAGSTNMYYDYMCNANGVLVVATQTKLEAFSLSGTSLGSVSGSFGQYHPIQYHDGHVFCNGFIFKLTVGENDAQFTQVGDAAIGGDAFNWSSGVFMNDSFYVVSKNTVYVVDYATNAVTDSYEFDAERKATYNLQGGAAYDSATQRLYWGTYSQDNKVHSIRVNADGTLDKGSYISADAEQKTACTPVVCNGRVYVAGQSGKIVVLNAEDLSLAYSVKAPCQKIQSTPIATTSNGVTYLYFQGYDGALYALADNGNSGTLITVASTMNPSGVANPNAFEQIAIDGDGNIYCYNESGYLFCYGKTACQVPTISDDLGTLQVRYSTNDPAAELFVTASVADGGTLSYQWQQSADKIVWADISGATTARHTPSTNAEGTVYYRCAITNTTDSGSALAYSNAANILVKPYSGNAALNVFVNNSNNASGAGKAATSTTDRIYIRDVATTPTNIWLGTIDDGVIGSVELLEGLTTGNLPSFTKKTSGNIASGITYNGYYRSTNYSLPVVMKVTVTAEDGINAMTYTVVIGESAGIAVEEAIASLGTVTLDSEAAIRDARAAYDALSDVQRSLVANYDVLAAAEETLAKLKDDAAGGKTAVENGKLNLFFEDCAAIGTYDGEPAYYFNASSLEEVDAVAFADLEGLMDGDGMIAAMESNSLVMGTNEAPVSAGYAITAAQIAADLDWEFAEGYSFDSFGDELYGYWIMDNDYNMYYVLISANPRTPATPEAPTFVAKVGADVIPSEKIAYKEDGYSYSGMVYDPGNPEADGWGYVYPVLTCGLYTVEVPAGTTTVDFEFSSACLAYGYDDDKFTCTEGADEYEGGFAGKAAATRSVDKDADGRMDFVQVQSPYDSNWNSTVYYAVTFSDPAADAARVVIGKIDAIGDVSLDSEAAIRDARAAYDALSDVQRSLVANYDVLAAAEETLAKLKDDAVAANAVDDAIAAIGEVTLDSEASIKNARAAYESLTDDQKARVTKFDVLAQAEATLRALKDAKLGKAYEETQRYLTDIAKASAPGIGSIGGEWLMLALARSNGGVDQATIDGYLENVVATVKDCDGVLHAKKYAEYSRVVIGLASLGYDATDVAGYNLLAPLADFDATVWQGINGPVWALLAFDAAGYEIPAAPEDKTQTTRENLIERILNSQNADGGWTLNEIGPDPDMTAMVIYALAPYFNDNADVKTAVDRALTYLSGIQQDDGGFSGSAGSNSESCAQVIVALCAMGIDPATDARFVKNGNTVLDALDSFAVDGGGFRHTVAENEPGGMSTEQALYALAAYDRFKSGGNRLFDMSDVEKKGAVVDKASDPDTPGEGTPGDNSSDADDSSANSGEGSDNQGSTADNASNTGEDSTDGTRIAGGVTRSLGNSASDDGSAATSQSTDGSASAVASSPERGKMVSENATPLASSGTEGVQEAFPWPIIMILGCLGTLLIGIGAGYLIANRRKQEGSRKIG